MTSSIDQEEPRPLTDTERALLDLLLEGDFVGSAQLRAQVQDCLVASNCICGCASLSIYVPEGTLAAPAENSDCPTLWQDADAIEVALLISDGFATGLEITRNSDGPARLPALAELRREPPRGRG